MPSVVHHIEGQRMFRHPYDEIGEMLRAVYNTDRKPLTWKMIDVLETLAETTELYDGESAPCPEPGVRKQKSG